MKIINKLSGYFCFVCVLCIFSFLSGCAAIFGGSHTVNIFTKQDSTLVTIVPKGASGSDHIRTLTIYGNVGHTRLKNRTKYYEIKEEKPGYFSQTMSITADKFNLWKLADIGIPLTCDVVLLINNNNSISGSNFKNSSEYLPIFYTGTWGWLDILFGRWATFPGKYELPPLVKIPHVKKADSNGKVYVKNIAINISKDSLIECYYKSEKDFEDNKLLRKDNIGESFTVRHSVFQDSMNDYLAKWNYIDTTGFFSFAYQNACYISCTINGLTINTIGGNTLFRVRSEWKLYGVTGDKEIYRTHLTGSANQENFYVSDYTVDNLMTRSLSQALTQFLALDTVSKCLKNGTDSKKAMNNWDTLKLSAIGGATSLQEAVKAVVTVKVPDGHGSGCIISSDGYLITNYHVIASDTSEEVIIINSSGDSLKAKYIRSNTSYDLALFKIENPGEYKFLNPNLSTSINIGTEVYAIGTPTDIALGQTMTKGIISSKRKVGNKTLIQTDVSINPGNSGGGLIDDKGTLQGIVNASLIRYGIQGIGFAIPAHYIQDALKIQFIQ